MADHDPDAALAAADDLDAERRARPRPRPAARHPDHREGRHRRRRPDHPRRFARPTSSIPSTTPSPSAALRQAGRGHPREGGHPRVRPRRHVAAVSQPPRPDPARRRLERRLGRRRRHRHGPGVARHRHPRLDPGAGRPLRPGGPQADLRAGPDRRHRDAVVDDGPRRADGDHRRRRRHHAGRARARARRRRLARPRRRRSTPRRCGSARSTWPSTRPTPRWRTAVRGRGRGARPDRLRRRRRRPDPTPATSTSPTPPACSSAGARPSTQHRSFGLDRALYWEEVADQLDGGRVGSRRRLPPGPAPPPGPLARPCWPSSASHDLLVMPTVPVVAPPVEDFAAYLMRLARTAIPWSFVGFPAITVPCGRVEGAPRGPAARRSPGAGGPPHRRGAAGGAPDPGRRLTPPRKLAHQSADSALW